MNDRVSSWPEVSRAALLAELARLRTLLEGGDAAARVEPSTDNALAQIQARFGLTDFERDLLVLCAGAEVDGGFAQLCAARQQDSRATAPTFGLALSILHNPHWSALSPCGPVRFWRMVEPGPGTLLTAAPLHIDERILHYLLGVSYLDERLQPFVELTQEKQSPLPCERETATVMAQLWETAANSLEIPVVQLTGRDAAARRRVAAAAAQPGRTLFAMRLEDIPAAPSERQSLATLWRRECLLGPVALMLDTDSVADASRSALAWFESLGGSIILASHDPVAVAGHRTVRLDVPAPDAEERRQLWRNALGASAPALAEELEGLAGSFSLPPPGLGDALASVGACTVEHVWGVCRQQARLRLGDLAQRIEPRATWDDLILPPTPKSVLREICSHVRFRAHVYETWGFGDKSARGLGLSALFSGPSGTGKTTAAEVIAQETRLDLYRVDLSGVVSKYIGETERNLRRVFDAAEASGAILLFDEADALFGKRSEVKDSHDRYANIEVSYLLQRMESYPGLAILTTNLKSVLDPAFLRRLRFVVEFPYPDAQMRAAIWRTIFPRQTETRGLDFERLARLNVTGGNIRNIALNAAFLAAAEREAVQMSHILTAAGTEYRKLEKPLTDAEVGGWV